MTTSARKGHAIRAQYEEVFTVNWPMKQVKAEVAAPIIFTEKDRMGVLYLHNDALVVTLLVTNYTTHMILIDNESSTNVLFWKVF